ncbi:hypothetical protein F8S13_20195 [Chloroflexia bacterium SDU3-3]|nr:hypothetical protein F8S13_20195 [Chloroflexia bacterium SDU3-3]
MARLWQPSIAVGILIASSIALSSCASAPVAQSQSGSVADERPNQGTALDPSLLANVDSALAAAKNQGKDTTVAQKLRDSAVELANKGLYEEANGNLKMAAGQLGILVGADGHAITPAAGQPYAPSQQAPAAAPRANERTLLTANFSQLSSLDGWEIVGPKNPNGTALWQIREGNLVQLGLDGMDDTGDPTGLVTGDPAWADVSVTASAMPHQTREVGVIARYADHSYYRLRAITPEKDSATSTYIIEKVIDEKATALARFEGPPLSQDTWHTITLSTQGSTLTALVDGVTLGTTSDTTLAAGRAGLATRTESGAYFANILVTGR